MTDNDSSPLFDLLRSGKLKKTEAVEWEHNHVSATATNLAGDMLINIAPEAPGFEGPENLERLKKLGVGSARLWMRADDRVCFIGDPPDKMAMIVGNGRGLLFKRGVTNR